MNLINLNIQHLQIFQIDQFPQFLPNTTQQQVEVSDSNIWEKYVWWRLLSV